MNANTIETCKFIIELVRETKQYTQNTSMIDLFRISTEISAHLSFLIGSLADLEMAYRQKVTEFMEAGDSNAKAEAKAKATEEYKHWRKVKLTYDLGEEQIKLLKKFSDKLEYEYQRS